MPVRFRLISWTRAKGFYDVIVVNLAPLFSLQAGRAPESSTDHMSTHRTQNAGDKLFIDPMPVCLSTL